MKKSFLVLTLLFLTGICRAETSLTVSAAASLKNVLTKIAVDYRKKEPKVKLQFNFAASGTLQRQIENGAPVDVFISAAKKNMDELQTQKMIDSATRRVLARNQLVLIVPKSSKVRVATFRDLKKSEVKRVAIGAPKSVPAGKYAQEVLMKIGIWKIVEPKAVRAKDVRGVLTQVEQGNVEAGIVYRTDALISSKVQVVAIASEKLHSPIRYPLAVVSASKNKPEAKRFAAYLMGASAQKRLRAFGFIVDK